MSAPNENNANNDAYLLNAFQQQQQQQFQIQQLQQGMQVVVDPQKSQPNSNSHSNLIVDNNANSFLTTSIPANNMNPIVGQQQQQQQLASSSSTVANISQQQLLELLAAVSNGRQTGVDSNNLTTVTVTMPTNTATALLQQQFLRQQQQQQVQQNNNSNVNTQAQLATLLQTQQPLAQNNLQQQQQQQHQIQRQHSLSLGNLQQIQQPQQQPQQRQHSLSLGNLNTLPQQQQQQQQPLLLGGLANNSNGSSTNANSTFLSLQQIGHQQVLANTQAIAPLTTNRKLNNNGNTKTTTTSQTKQFLLFIKILLKCLDATSNNILKERTKAIVSECTKRNRLGDPNYQPLQQAVEQRLRPVVGEQWWTRAQTYAQTYQTKQPQLKQRVALVRQQQQQQLARQQQQQHQFAIRNPVLTRL